MPAISKSAMSKLLSALQVNLQMVIEQMKTTHLAFSLLSHCNKG